MINAAVQCTACQYRIHDGSTGHLLLISPSCAMLHCYALPKLLLHFTGKKPPNGEMQLGQVQISTAFQSPDLLQNCLAFLRQYAVDTASHAACAVVPKDSIAYPQVQETTQPACYSSPCVCCLALQNVTVLQSKYLLER